MDEQETLEVTKERLPFTMFHNCIMEDPRLNKHDLLVYLVLAYHADASELISWPSKNTIEDESRLSVRKVDQVIKKLEELHHITVKRRKKPGSKLNFSNIYCLTPIKTQILDNPKTNNDKQPLDDKDTVQHAGGVPYSMRESTAQYAPELDSVNNIHSNNINIYTPINGGTNENSLENLKKQIENTFESLGKQSKLTLENISHLQRLITTHGEHEVSDRVKMFYNLCTLFSEPSDVYKECFNDYIGECFDAFDIDLVYHGKVNFFGFSKVFQHIPAVYADQAYRVSYL